MEGFWEQVSFAPGVKSERVMNDESREATGIVCVRDLNNALFILLCLSACLRFSSSNKILAFDCFNCVGICELSVRKLLVIHTMGTRNRKPCSETEHRLICVYNEVLQMALIDMAGVLCVT